MAPARVEDVDWARLLERLCYLFPPVIGVGAVGLLQDAELGIPVLQRGLVLFGASGYSLLTAGVAATVFLDARRARATRGWRPTPWLEALAAIGWAPAAGVWYLYRRHERFGTPAGWSGWWLVVAVSLATSVAGVALAAIGIVLALPELVGAPIALAGAVAFGAFPVAIHRDAAFVCTRRVGWSPNPGAYLGFAFLSPFVPPFQPLLAAYYLFRRRTVGTP